MNINDISNQLSNTGMSSIYSVIYENSSTVIIQNNQMYQNQNVNYVLKISYLEILSSLLPEKSMSSEPKKRQYNSTAAMISDYKKYVPLILTR